MAAINLGDQGPSAIPETRDQRCLRQFGESYVKLLISSRNLTKEKEKAVEEILIKAVKNYAKFHENPRDDVVQSVKSFVDYLCEAYMVTLVSVDEGSVIIILDCPTLESLELIWSDYRSGHLDKVAERHLVSDEIKKFNLDTICLKTSIEKENYLKCRRALVKLPSTSSDVLLSKQKGKKLQLMSRYLYKELAMTSPKGSPSALKELRSISEDRWREMKEFRRLSAATQGKIEDWTSFSEDIQRDMKEYSLISEASQRKIKGKNL